jgi:acetyltransferase-like isoleucine patch superfamily enzyme
MDNEFGFKEVGCKIKIYSPISLIQPEKMVLKSHIMLSEFSYLASGKGLFIGNYTHISTHNSILGGGYCIIHDFVAVAAGTRILTGSESVMGDGISCGPMIPSEYRKNFQSYVILEKHAFIGTNVVILPGVTVGEGAVIAAGSVVNHNLEPWCIYSGFPAKKIAKRPQKNILKMEAELLDKYSIVLTDFSTEVKTAKSIINNNLLYI